MELKNLREIDVIVGFSGLYDIIRIVFYFRIWVFLCWFYFGAGYFLEKLDGFCRVVVEGRLGFD